MDFNAFQRAVAEAAKAMGIADYELYYQSAESTQVSTYCHAINEFSSAVEGGVCFRCIVNGKMGYASTEDLSAQAAAQVVRRAADNAAVLESDEPVFLGQGGQRYESCPACTMTMPGAEALVAKALEAEADLYAAHPSVVDGSGITALGEKLELAIVNSKGLDLHYERTLTGLVTSAVVEEAGEKVDAYEVKIADLAGMDLAGVTAKAVEKARAKLGGDVAPTGCYPVVFSPNAMASLLTVYSPVFSSENALKGLSKLQGKEGEVIAAGCVTLVDDPLSAMSALPMPFDAEGTPTRKKAVVEAGRLETLLYNHKTAALAGKETTGNASKAGYDAAVAVRPFTFYLAAGELSEEEVLQKAGKGVYINSLGGLHAGANVISGDFSLQSAGFMIENGKKTTPVKSFTVAGNFFDVLRQITAVADDLEVPNPGGITAFGSPTVLVEGLSIAGK